MEAAWKLNKLTLSKEKVFDTYQYRFDSTSGVVAIPDLQMADSYFPTREGSLDKAKESLWTRVLVDAHNGKLPSNYVSIVT